MSQADLAVERDGDAAIVCVRCALDAHTGPALERRVVDAVADGAQAVALDLGECPLLDAFGVRALIRARRRADEAGVSLRISLCSPAAECAIRRMHLDGVLGMPLACQDGSPFRPSSRFHRFVIRESIHLWDGLLHRTGHTLGMSPEGMVVEVTGPLRPFQVLRIEMALSEAGTSCRFTGRVTRCRTGEPTFAEIEFLSVDPSMRRWLQERAPRLAEPAPAPPRRKP